MMGNKMILADSRLLTRGVAHFLAIQQKMIINAKKHDCENEEAAVSSHQSSSRNRTRDLLTDFPAPTES